MKMGRHQIHDEQTRFGGAHVISFETSLPTKGSGVLKQATTSRHRPLFGKMSDTMKADVRRLLPRVQTILNRLERDQ